MVAAERTRDSETSDLHDLETIRREHLNAEAGIKALGWLCLMGGTFLGLIGIGYFAASNGAADRASFLWSGIAMAAFSTCLVTTGALLRRLNPWGRALLTMISLAFVLLPIVQPMAWSLPRRLPSGFLIWGLLVYIALWTSKPRTVFSPHYRRAVVPGTPLVETKIRVAAFTVLFGVVGLIGFAQSMNDWS